MAKAKKRKPSRKNGSQEPILAPNLANTIPLQVLHWIEVEPGKHALVLLKQPDGRQFSVELYDVPVAHAESLCATAQDYDLQTAFSKAIIAYNVQAFAQGKTVIQ